MTWSDLSAPSGTISLMLSGDVMLGRGVDQIFPQSNDPRLHEAWRGVDSAYTFVELSVRRNGPLPEPRGYEYVWGDILPALTAPDVDLRLVNLETAVTTCDDHWPGKNIHYRMHPNNVSALKNARIDCCALANNHVLDWGYGGLTDTIETLTVAGIRTAGAGRNRQLADLPAIIQTPDKGCVAVFSFAEPSSIVPINWAAGADSPGVSLFVFSDFFYEHMANLIRQVKDDVGIVVASIHWGGNWGYDIPATMRRFAHRLIEEAGVDVIHGHSSHHVKGIEVYRNRLILYGAGDLINDYEGIPLLESSGSNQKAELHRRFRPDLGLLYRAHLDAGSGRLRGLEMTPTQIRQLRVNPADQQATEWLRNTLNREGRGLGTRVELAHGNLRLYW